MLQGESFGYRTLDPKPRESEPFTTIMNEFITRMGNADICIVIVLSFRDKSISDLLIGLKSKKLIIIDDKAITTYYERILGIEVPSKDSIAVLANGIRCYYSVADNTNLIFHNIEKSSINDVVWAVKELMTKNLGGTFSVHT